MTTARLTAGQAPQPHPNYYIIGNTTSQATMPLASPGKGGKLCALVVNKYKLLPMHRRKFSSFCSPSLPQLVQSLIRVFHSKKKQTRTTQKVLINSRYLN